jgi:hypothetical protein
MSDTLTDQIREAVRQSELSHYEMCRQTRIDKASMSRFINGHGGLSLANLDKLADLLGLRITSTRKAK